MLAVSHAEYLSGVETGKRAPLSIGIAPVELIPENDWTEGVTKCGGHHT